MGLCEQNSGTSSVVGAINHKRAAVPAQTLTWNKTQQSDLSPATTTTTSAHTVKIQRISQISSLFFLSHIVFREVNNTIAFVRFALRENLTHGVLYCAKAVAQRSFLQNMLPPPSATIIENRGIMRILIVWSSCGIYRRKEMAHGRPRAQTHARLSFVMLLRHWWLN